MSAVLNDPDAPVIPREPVFNFQSRFGGWDCPPGWAHPTCACGRVCYSHRPIPLASWQPHTETCARCQRARFTVLFPR